METTLPGAVALDRRGAVLTLKLNRPAKKNALTAAMYSRLVEALDEAQRDDEIRAVLISGSEDSFTSGNDVGDFLQHPPAGPDSSVFGFLAAISTFEKPLVAAVNGLAIGIGTTLLLHCDLVYAAQNAVFRLPFIDLALVPEAASSLLLPQMMGHVRAAELLLLGEAFSAAKAERYGLVNEVVPAAELESLALSKATALSCKAPEALRLSKRLMKQANNAVLEQVMAEEGKLFAERLTSPEAKAVMQAFIEKGKKREENV